MVRIGQIKVGSEEMGSVGESNLGVSLLECFLLAAFLSDLECPTLIIYINVNNLGDIKIITDG